MADKKTTSFAEFIDGVKQGKATEDQDGNVSNATFKDG